MKSYIFYSLLFFGLIIEMLSYQLLKQKENPKYFAMGILCFVFISIYSYLDIFFYSVVRK